jgi:hypothetical protein
MEGLASKASLMYEQMRSLNMIDSSSKDLGPCAEAFEFRLAPEGVSEFVMVSSRLNCIFVFTSHNRVWSPQLCNSALDVLLKVQ